MLVVTIDTQMFIKADLEQIAYNATQKVASTPSMEDSITIPLNIP